jgi:hypothetical protein
VVNPQALWQLDRIWQREFHAILVVDVAVIQIEGFLMPGNKIELNGIAIEVHNREYYLEVLSHAMETIPFYSPVLRKTVAEAVGHAPPADARIGLQAMMRVLGFIGHELIEVLDREWHDYDENEADRLFEFASSRQLFSSIKSVYLWGAGSCRLADYLASLESLDQVICSDLSWPALYFGRALIEANYAELPELLTKARIFYHVEPQSTQLIRTTKDSRFKAPLTPCDRRQCIQYSVRDAFAALNEPITADLIAVPYLLDNFAGAQCMTLLLRICQRVRAGQQIVILVTCIPERRAGSGRDPALIMDVLRRCGFKIQFLELVFLPYSFSYYSYARKHTDWNTLVVRAERLVERDIDIVIAKSDRRDAIQANQPDKANPLDSANRDLILSKLRSAENYQAMADALIPQMGAMEFENAIGELASRGSIDLRFDTN